MTNRNYISRQVRNLVNRYGTRDPFELCNCLNIRVSYRALGPTVKAYFFCQSRIKNIILNPDESAEMLRILCAHELGHAVLHTEIAKSGGFPETNLFQYITVTENEANLFAAELLIDDDELLILAEDREKSFFDIAKEFYVPPELLDLKLRTLKSKNLPVNQTYLYQTNFLKRNMKYS